MNAGIADPEVRKKNLVKKNHRMWNGKLWASQLVAQWWQDTAKRSGDEVVDLMHLFLVSFEINSVKISRKEAQCGIGKWAFGDVCNLAAFVPHALRRTSHRIARIHGLLVLFEDPIIKSYWMIHSETPCLLICPGQLETKAIIGMFFQVRIREGLLKLKTGALRTAHSILGPHKRLSQISQSICRCARVFVKWKRKQQKPSRSSLLDTCCQDGLTGSAWGDWANYTDSPLRAFEGELGVSWQDIQDIQEG